MAIGVTPLLNCVNQSITNVSTYDALGILQLIGASQDFQTLSVYSVADLASLPPAAENTGRIVFVQSTCGYRYSDGVEWSNDFTSTARGGEVWAWGDNVFGKLGDGTTVSKSSPVSVIGGFTDWCQVAAGVNHNLAIRSNGTAWAWGRNGFGRLGDGTVTDRSSPVSVIGGFTDWCRASAGGSHSLAVRTNGTLWAWGVNGVGQLGDGTTVDKSSPVSVVGGFTDWCQASASGSHSLGIRSNGTLWAWGSNTAGRLGDGTTTNKSSPVSVVGGFTDWCQVSAGGAGGAHSLGVRSNGTLWAWGCNNSGQLGDGTTTSRLSPVSVAGGFTDWCQVSAGYGHSLGVRANGTLWAWGCNGCGRLGDGTTTNRSSPVSVVGGFTDWCQVSAGNAHSAAIRTDGTAWAWGCNGDGRLGDGTTTCRSSPVSVVGGFADWCRVSSGFSHILALRPSKGF